MKKLLLILLCLPLLTFAQDNIVLKNGEEINAKILEVGESNVKYKRFNNQNGPVYTKSKDEIFFIKYSNGEKDVFSSNSSNNSRSKNTQNKKVLISGASTFMYESGFDNDYFYSTSNLSLTASVGGFLTNNFVLGASLLVSSVSNGGLHNSSSTATTVIGPFIRGYAGNFYSQVGYALNKDINALSLGIGHQLFLNESKSVSLNPIIIYYSRDYTNMDIQQDGILIGCSFEVHL